MKEIKVPQELIDLQEELTECKKQKKQYSDALDSVLLSAEKVVTATIMCRLLQQRINTIKDILATKCNLLVDGYKQEELKYEQQK